MLKLLPPGYSVEGRGHKRLIDPAGDPVRRHDGKPLTVPNTPGDRRAMKIMQLRLRQCGIETKTPTTKETR
jgi:hypothetical protein